MATVQEHAIDSTSRSVTAAAATLRIEVDEATYQEVRDALGGFAGLAKVAISTALNKTAKNGRTMLVRSLAGLMGANVTGVRRRINIFRATTARLVAGIVLKGHLGVNLIYFHAKQTGTGVSANVSGQSQDFPHAFIAHGAVSHNFGTQKMVFLRKGARRMPMAGRYKDRIATRGQRAGLPLQRQPLVVLRGSTVVETFETTPGFSVEQIKRLDEQLAKNLGSQVDWLNNRKKGQDTPPEGGAV